MNIQDLTPLKDSVFHYSKNRANPIWNVYNLTDNKTVHINEEDYVKKRSVLFVDDEREILSSIKRLLIDEPYDILTSGSGEDALQILKHKDVQVVVVDLNMPKMDGLSLLKAIERFNPNIIRLVLSVSSDSDSILSATNQGKVHRYITKP